MTDVGLMPDLGRGPAIQLASGRPFYLLDPRPNEVHIEDITASLSKLCRYSGHVHTFYSVAQHSVLCADYLRPHGGEAQLAGLLHDAAEAYIGDISRPLKVALDDRAPGVLARIEHRIMGVIASRYGLDFPFPPIVKHADNVLLATEKRDLMPDIGAPWIGLPDPLPFTVDSWTPAWAEMRFRARFKELSE